MSMVVQHNITAMNSNRLLGVTTSEQAKSTEKLSSGLKINRAADDASGLSISEKMRRQIRGLTQASANAQDGISCVQTAEGALGEVHSMLQRMDELATKAATGTMSRSDRQDVQNEIDNLLTEIDRVSETTKFNETYLLKGTAGTISNSKQIAMDMRAHDAGIAGTFSVNAKGNVGVLKIDLSKLTSGSTIMIGSKQYKIASTTDTNIGNTTVSRAAIGIIRKDDIAALAYSALVKANYAGVADVKGNKLAGAKKMAEVNSLTSLNGQTTGTDFIAFSITAGQTYVQRDLALNLHVGADADGTNKINLKIKSMDTAGLGIAGLTVMDDEGADQTGEMATYAIDAIEDAIKRVSEQRSTLGAVQNRIEHTIKNVDNVIENTTAAESQIRDTDMASQMVNYSKNNILAQAGQAMLAQANQSNQGVLSLLG